jgi:cyclase
MAQQSTFSLAFAMVFCLGSLAGAAAAQVQTAPPKPQQSPAPLSAVPIRGGVYWVKGGNGANTGFIVGAKEVIVIDAKMIEDSARAMQAEIAKVTSNPIRQIVLTHSDGDHVNGLVGFPSGLTIVAHANTRKDMEAAFKDPKMSALQPYLPNVTFDASRPLNVDSVRVDLLYFGPAHTSGDVVVYLPAQKIAFIGDLAFVGRDPLIHVQKGGTSLGLVQVLNKILALDADTFIAGHTEPLTKGDIRALVTSIEEKQAKMKTLIQQGKSLDEIKKAFGVTDTPGPGGRGRPSFIEVIYGDLTGKK